MQSIQDKRQSFRHRPYLRDKMLNDHYDELKQIECRVDELLAGSVNYDGIDFCDVHAGGVQVRIHHKQIKGYTYGHQVTINYDFSNMNKVPEQVANAFKYYDTPDRIMTMKSFIAQGERYGWD